MSWFEARPTAAFEDADAARTVALASAVSRFGIVLAKAGGSVSLHLGVAPHEEHHVRSLPDVDVAPADGGPPAAPSPDGGGGDPDMVEFRLRESYAVPLCAAPEPCLLYAHSAELPDFVAGLAGRRVPDSVVAGRRGALARRAASLRRRSGSGGGPGGRGAERAAAAAALDRMAASKLDGGPFFLCRIFASCRGGGLGRLASSINFAHAGSGPNSLVPRPRRLRLRGGDGSGPLLRSAELAEPPARLPRLFGRGTAPVLSPAEMASILALPPSMFGLQAQPGAGRTFTNALTDAADPAAPFERTAEWGQ